MIASRQPLAASLPAVVSDQYVIAFGKSGGLGCFTVLEPLELNRGDRVVVRTPRGLELGEVRGPATIRQARLIGAQTSGDILRRATDEDQAVAKTLRQQANSLYDACRACAIELAVSVQILDVEVLLDGQHALAQFVGGAEADITRLAETMQVRAAVEIRFENLATPARAEPEEHEQGGCGKPDCGRTEGGAGGCTTCSTGSGCSSCGSGQVDLRPYFSHLRDKMEATHRTPLV